MDDLALMRARADTLFTYDARGRMLLTNEPREDARRPAPRLFLGWTTSGYVLRLGATLPDVAAQRLKALVERLPPIAALDAPPPGLAALRRELERHTPVVDESGGPAYRFPAPFPRQGEAVRLTGANRALLRDTFPWLHDEIDDWQPGFAVVHDGAAVSVCVSSRLTPVAAEAGVDTLPDYRGRGYAAAVTAAWGAAIQASGRAPFYSTSWANLASRAVARRLGLILFGTDASWG